MARTSIKKTNSSKTALTFLFIFVISTFTVLKIMARSHNLSKNKGAAYDIDMKLILNRHSQGLTPVSSYNSNQGGNIKSDNAFDK